MSHMHRRGHKSGRPINLPPRAVTLVAVSLALLAGSAVLYLTELPSLIASPPLAEQKTEPKPSENEAEDGAPENQESPALEETDEGEASESNAEKEDEEAPEAPSETAASPEEEHSSPEEGNTTDTDRPKAETPAPSVPENPGNTASDTTEDIAASTPSAAEEEAFRSFLSGKASSIPGYVSQASACASSFENDSVGASLSVRQSHRGTCAALTQQLFSEYVAVRDYVRSNNSQYCDEQERLIGSYRCLMSYVGCYSDAWDINVSFDDPSSHVGEFSGPLSASGGYLSEFHSYYDGLAI